MTKHQRKGTQTAETKPCVTARVSFFLLPCVSARAYFCSGCPAARQGLRDPFRSHTSTRACLELGKPTPLGRRNFASLARRRLTSALQVRRGAPRLRRPRQCNCQPRESFFPSAELVGDAGGWRGLWQRIPCGAAGADFAQPADRQLANGKRGTRQRKRMRSHR